MVAVGVAVSLPLETVIMITIRTLRGITEELPRTFRAQKAVVEVVVKLHQGPRRMKPPAGSPRGHKIL